jgi:hypothetical protein
LFGGKKAGQAKVSPEIIESELKEIDRKMGRLVDLQLSVDVADALQQQYAERLQELSEQKKIKTRVLTVARAELEASKPNDFLNGIARIQAMGTDAFWTLDPAIINQELLKLVGRNRFLVDIKTSKIASIGEFRVGRSKY